MSATPRVPSVSVTYARDGRSTESDSYGMRPMQARAYQKRGEQYLLIKSPPASGKSRALMFIALDKLQNQKLRQAIIVVPERSIGSSFHDEPLSKHGFWADWKVEPRWNLCDAPGPDGDGKVNLLERAFGTHPLVADVDVGLAPDPNAAPLSIIYRQSIAASDLVITVQESSDLSSNSWSAASGTETTLSDDGITRTIRFTPPLTGTSRKFLRLHVIGAP